MTNIFASITLTTVNPVSFSHHGQEGLPMMTRGVDSEGRHLRTVFLPAAALRGRIRHEVAFNAMERSGQVKLGQAYMMALGQSTDGRVEDEGDVAYRIAEQRAIREKDPIVDLFGTWKINSRLQVSHLLPDANVHPDRFSYIRRDLDSNEDIFNRLSPEDQDAFYERQETMSQASKAGDMIKAATSALMKAKKAKAAKEETDAIEAKIAELKALQAAHKDEAGGDGNNSKHLLEVEAIPAGLDLHGTLVVKHAKPRDLTMLVNAFDRISQRPLVGAHTARGCGEVKGRVTFTDGEGEVLAVVAFGGYGSARIEWTQAGDTFKGA